MDGGREGGSEGGRVDQILVTDTYIHVHAYACELLDLHKSKQGNTTNLNISFSMENEKKSCSGGIRTHDIMLTRQMLYQLSYRGRSAG